MTNKVNKVADGKMSKFQTTKVIIFIILSVWVCCTYGILYLLAFETVRDMKIVEIMSIYTQVTLAMNTGVIGYIAKSTYENKNKYGNTPYGEKSTNKEEGHDA